MVIIVFGLPGSGKTFFATRLASSLNARYLNTDVVRRELLRDRTYSPDEKLHVYDALLNEVRKAIDEPCTIVLDGTFYKRAIREAFRTRANECGVPAAFIEVRAADDIVKQRLGRPRQYSEADFTVYRKIKAEFEPMEEPHLVLSSTDENIEDMLREAGTYLSGKKH